MRPVKKRTVVPNAPGSAGDLSDRMRDVYRPGANPTPAPGLANPFSKSGRKQIGDFWNSLFPKGQARH
jgi:hypothetical protein